jgi:hypothetical protein
MIKVILLVQWVWKRILSGQSWLKVWVPWAWIIIVKWIWMLVFLTVNIREWSIFTKLVRNIDYRQTLTAGVFIQSVLLFTRASTVLQSYLDFYIIIKFEWIFLFDEEFWLRTKDFHFWFWLIPGISLALFDLGILLRGNLFLRVFM